MLAFWRPTIGWPTFLRTLIRPWVVVLRPLITIGAANLAGRILSLFRLSVRLPVARRGADFELVELVPLFIGTVPFRDGIELSDPTARINGFWISHGDIMDHTAVLIQYSLKMKPGNNPKTVDRVPRSDL